MKIEPTKFFYTLLLSFVAVELITWVLSQFDVGVSFLKGGFIIILFLVTIFLVTLWQFGTNINSLKIKDIIVMVLVLVVLTASYFILPFAIPQIFSIIPGNEFRNFIIQRFGSVISMGSGMV